MFESRSRAASAVLVACAFSCACDRGIKPRECTVNDDCLQAGVPGACLPSPTSDAMWCAFPDPSCPSPPGQRWGVLAGEDLDKECVAAVDVDAGPDVDAVAIDAGPVSTLTVTNEDPSLGTVVSSPVGISCGDTCTAMFPTGTAVTLTASPDVGGRFGGWTGACVGFEIECIVDLVGDQQAGASFGSPGSRAWLGQFGGTGYDSSIGVAVSQGGDLYVGGGRSFAQAALTSIDAETGAVRWERVFSASSAYVTAVAVRADGDAVVTGAFSGAMILDGVTLSSAGQADIFVARLARTDGAVLWAKRFGAGGYDEGLGIAVDAGGDLAVVGHFSGTNVDFGGIVLSSAGQADALVAKLSGANGGTMWAKRFGGAGHDQAIDTSLAALGHFAVVGRFEGTVNFGGGNLAAQAKDGFVLMVNGGDGSYLWATKQGGTSDFEATNAVGVAQNGNVIVLGQFSGTASIGANAVSSAGGQDMFLAEYSSGGAFQRAMAIGGVMNDRGAALTVAPDDRVLVQGEFSGTITLDGVTQNAAGATDPLVVSLDPDWLPEWSLRVGGGLADYGGGIGLLPWGGVCVAGSFEGVADFDGVTLTSSGMADGFVMAVLP